jgi:hypothetical protein
MIHINWVIMQPHVLSAIPTASNTAPIGEFEALLKTECDILNDDECADPLYPLPASKLKNSP